MDQGTDWSGVDEGGGDDADFWPLNETSKAGPPSPTLSYGDGDDNTTTICGGNVTPHLHYPFCPTYQKEIQGLAFILLGPVNLAVGIVGILINVVTIIVLVKQHQFKATPKIIMITLAISDIIEIINQWIFWGAIKTFSKRSNPFVNFLFLNYHFFHPVYRTFLTFNRGVTLLMTIDRWFIVCRTLLANRWWTTKKVFWIIASLAFYSIIINIPNIFEYGLKEKPCIDHRTMQVSSFKFLSAHESALGCNKYFIWGYITIFHTGVVTIFPCLLMILFNSMTIKTLMNNMNDRGSHRGLGGCCRRHGSGRCGGGDNDNDDNNIRDNGKNDRIANSNGDGGDDGGGRLVVVAGSAGGGDARGGRRGVGGPKRTEREATPLPTRSLLRTHSKTPDVNKSITIMCIAVTTLFIVFQTPYTVHNIGSTVYYRLNTCDDVECKAAKKCEEIDRQCKYKERVMCFRSCNQKLKSVYESNTFIAIVNICLCLNSSINGCIYFCAGSSFRQKFFEIFMPWRCQRQSRSSNESVGSTRVRLNSSSKTDCTKFTASQPFSSPLRYSNRSEKKVQLDMKE